MPVPLDVFLGEELSKNRQDAIDAVRASGCEDDNSAEFWSRVERVQSICAKWSGIQPLAAAKALSIVSPYLSCDGEYGHVIVTDSDINPLVLAVATAINASSN